MSSASGSTPSTRRRPCRSSIIFATTCRTCRRHGRRAGRSSRSAGRSCARSCSSTPGGAFAPFIICTVVWAASGAGDVLAGLAVDLPRHLPRRQRLAPVRAGAASSIAFRPSSRAAAVAATATAAGDHTAGAPVSARETEAGSGSLHAATERALQGGPERHRDKAREQGKLPVRERVGAAARRGLASPRRRCWRTGRRTGSAPTAS